MSEFLCVLSHAFQFQTGSIKSMHCRGSMIKLMQFQFQTGSIKRDRAGFVNIIAPRRFQFQTGSIKSQLSHQAPFRSKQFQFQTGSIKSGNIYFDAGRAYRFQFQTGSIKRLSPCFITRYFVFVSIPNWFD